MHPGISFLQDYHCETHSINNKWGFSWLKMTMVGWSGVQYKEFHLLRRINTTWPGSWTPPVVTAATTFPASLSGGWSPTTLTIFAAAGDWEGECLPQPTRAEWSVCPWRYLWWSRSLHDGYSYHQAWSLSLRNICYTMLALLPSRQIRGH